MRESLLSILFNNKTSFKNINIQNIFISYIGNNNICEVEDFLNQNQYWGNLPMQLLANKVKSTFVHISLKNTNPFKLKNLLKK